MWAQSVPCSNATITSFLLDWKEGRRMPGSTAAPAWGCPVSCSLSECLCCLKEQIWTAQEGTVRMSHKGHNGDLAQLAGATTTQLQADIEEKSCKYVLSFGNREEFKV